MNLQADRYPRRRDGHIITGAAGGDGIRLVIEVSSAGQISGGFEVDMSDLEADLEDIYDESDLPNPRG